MNVFENENWHSSNINHNYNLNYILNPHLMHNFP